MLFKKVFLRWYGLPSDGFRICLDNLLGLFVLLGRGSIGFVVTSDFELLDRFSLVATSLRKEIFEVVNSCKGVLDLQVDA